MSARLSAAAAAIALAAVSAQAADRADPFDTEKLAPASRGQQWARGTGDPCADARPQGDTLTLADAVSLALCHNPQTHESWAAARVAAAQVGVSTAPFLPQVSATVEGESGRDRISGVTTQHTRFGVAASATYLLFDFGGRDANLERAQQALLAADWTHNRTLQNVILATAEAYYGVFSQRGALEAARAAEQTSVESLRAAEARYSAGRATRAETLQARTAYSQAVLIRTRADGDVKVAQGVLASTLGLDANFQLNLAAPRDPAFSVIAQRQVDELISAAKSARPDLTAAEAQVRAAGATVRATEAAGKPNLSLFGNASAAQSTLNTDPRAGAVGVTLSIPLFTGYENTYRIRSAREELDRQIALREQVANRVALEVWRAYQNLQSDGEALKAAQDLAASAAESYQLNLGRYRAGAGNILDMLNAQSALALAEVQLNQAQYNWYVSKVRLVGAIGALDLDAVSQAVR